MIVSENKVEKCRNGNLLKLEIYFTEIISYIFVDCKNLEFKNIVKI